jgi:hypothetical protein
MHTLMEQKKIISQLKNKGLSNMIYLNDDLNIEQHHLLSLDRKNKEVKVSQRRYEKQCS